MKLKLMSMAAMALSALLCLTTTGAWAGVGYPFTWSASNLYDGSGSYVPSGTAAYLVLDGFDVLGIVNEHGYDTVKSAFESKSVEYTLDYAQVDALGAVNGEETFHVSVDGAEAYLLVFTGENLYVSETVTAASSAFAFGDQTTVSSASPKLASGGFQGAGWYTSSAPAGYSVSLKEGTEDASNWQGKAGEGAYQLLPLEGVAAGTAVTVKYNGTKKVKSVKAVKKAAPAATVTTAPTAKTGVKAGQNEAIVNAGTAEGGTMMYMVNATQPASTDGFSATVPTAEGLTAGTYYVWYYVEGDASHTDSEISATGIEVTIAAAGPKAAAEATAEDKGKLIGRDGKIYDNVAAATAAGTTAAAKIIYIGTTGHATYNHGLALALTDEGQMNWNTAISTCSGKNTSTPVTGATWLLASKDQWEKMISAAGSGTALRDGFSGITGASNLQSASYWSSTETSGYAWVFPFGSGNWYTNNTGWGGFYVRACLAF